MRGLYLEAERDGKMDAARRFAEQAYEEAPQIPWSANAVFRFRSADGEWAQALATLDANQSAGLVDGDTARRARAVLLTAMGLDSEDREPDMALKHVLEAIRLAPSLVPAVVTAGRIRVRQGDIGRAIKGLETGWKAAQHPEIADQYIHVRTGDSAIDRLKRAERLLSLNRASAEGAFAVAEAAISARNWAKARKALANVPGKFADRARMPVDGRNRTQRAWRPWPGEGLARPRREGGEGPDLDRRRQSL